MYGGDASGVEARARQERRALPAERVPSVSLDSKASVRGYERICTDSST